jgi:uncharacterized protein YodC (DUF2158 family)
MTDTPSFTEGDVVRLKSGGPKMTVTVIGANAYKDAVWCQWFDGMNSKTERFKIKALEMVQTPSPKEEDVQNGDLLRSRID